MKTRLFVIALFFCFTTQAQSVCGVYQEISQDLGCPPSNYLTSFGGKYCELFLKRGPEFSEQGQVFMRKVRACLIKEISQSHFEGQITCENVGDIAIDQHVNCYAQSGFCTMGSLDKARLFKMVWRDMFHANLLSMMVKMNSACRPKEPASHPLAE